MDRASFWQETQWQQLANDRQQKSSKNSEARLNVIESITKHTNVKNNDYDSAYPYLKDKLKPDTKSNTFLKTPLVNDLSKLKTYDLAVLGIPYTSNFNHKSGTNFGPQGIRRISASYNTYNREIGGELCQKINICDLGDLNLIYDEEKNAFSLISQGVFEISKSGVFPVILGGDRSITFPVLKGISQALNHQKIGIIHFTRRLLPQTVYQEKKLSTYPGLPTEKLKNIATKNIVQLGISDRQIPDNAFIFGQENFNNNILTAREIAKYGLDAAADLALKQALDGTDRIYLSFDINCIDTYCLSENECLETSYLLPKEALYLLTKIIKNAPICGLEVVGVSPPNEVGNIEAIMATRIICSAIANLISSQQITQVGERG
jgi:agmatinase